MDKAPKKGLIIFLACLGIVALLFWYPQYRKTKAVKEAELIGKKAYELGRLMRTDPSGCVAVISESEKFLENHKDAVQIWDLKGACEFELGQFAAAKLSFEKVLELDPGHEAAKRSLESLNPPPGQQVVTGPVGQIDQTQFESTIDVNLGGVLGLVSAEKRSTDISEHYNATYASSGNYAETVAFLKAALQKARIVSEIINVDSATVFLVNSDTEQKTFTVIPGESVKVVVKYVRHQ